MSGQGSAGGQERPAGTLAPEAPDLEIPPALTASMALLRRQTAARARLFRAFYQEDGPDEDRVHQAHCELDAIAEEIRELEAAEDGTITETPQSVTVDPWGGD